MGAYNRELPYRHAEKIYDICTAILDKSEKDQIPAQQAAIEMAWSRIEAMGKVKMPY